MSAVKWDSGGKYGTVDLEALRALYRDSHSSSADGEPMPAEPEAGHIHKLGSDRDPIIIVSIDYGAGSVRIQRISNSLAKHLVRSEFNLPVTRDKIIVPARERFLPSVRSEKAMFQSGQVQEAHDGSK